MGDLHLMNSSSCSPSGALLHFSAGSLKGCERVLTFKDPQLAGIARLNLEPFRSLQPSSHSQRIFQCKALLDDRRSPFSFHVGEDGKFTKEEEDLNIFERLSLAWKVLFPKRKKISTPAEIAKQRLKMILISDRCSVNDTAKRRIVSNIVGALANFVEIESQDRVQLNVSADPDLGTVYSVSVPVRRVKPEFQDNGNDLSNEKFRENIPNFLEEKFEFPVASKAEESEELEMGVLASKVEEAYSTSKALQDLEG